MLRMVFAILMVLITPILVFSTTDDGKPVKVIIDADVTQFNYWSSDTVYNLDGFVYVEDGEVLIIEPGTVIKGNPGQAENATALIVTRGGRIYAEGTPCDPIFFTSIDDDVDEFDDLPLGELGRGLWGG
ncbi:MAG: T9SS C-terminal target domain-containing protein, partial [candidate division Zixibacteria bacterium]|nr:T9SS C-terminal target domain-containing protein [candidate division Zixibacteria bacterium]